MYFEDCTTPEEVKEKYRILAKALHPDKCGIERYFARLQSEYEERLQPKASPKKEAVKHKKQTGIDWNKTIKQMVTVGLQTGVSILNTELKRRLEDGTENPVR
ncbi:MAG: J domain-containing protein [Candidatus Kapabacteria bacterium]|nr:J domain-containing protein [Candidatus Kapabacteria bacterium]